MGRPCRSFGTGILGRRFGARNKVVTETAHGLTAREEGVFYNPRLCGQRIETVKDQVRQAREVLEDRGNRLPSGEPSPSTLGNVSRLPDVTPCFDATCRGRSPGSKDPPRGVYFLQDGGAAGT